MTPLQARAARAMLGLDMKAVCAMAEIGKRTLTEFESGTRTINTVTSGKLKAFYIANGIEFSNTSEGESVKYRSPVDQKLSTENAIGAKFEYLDLLGIERMIDNINQMDALISSLRTDAQFTRKLFVRALEISGLNQKQLAEYLECSPAFVSAMVVDNKRISETVAGKLQPLVDRLGLNATMTSWAEKRIRKELELVGSRISEIRNVLVELRNAQTTPS